jgi:uncharacterized membrane protein YccC
MAGVNREDFAVGAGLGATAGLLLGLSQGLTSGASANLIDLISKLSPLAIFLAASAAAVIAYMKFKSDREAQRFSNAVSFYRRYLELAFSHTKYAEPDNGFNEITQPEDYKEYEWFLGILFRACEELLEHSEGSADKQKWHETITSQLRYHKKYLRESQWLNEGDGSLSYSEELRKLIQTVKAEPDDVVHT